MCGQEACVSLLYSLGVSMYRVFFKLSKLGFFYIMQMCYRSGCLLTSYTLS